MIYFDASEARSDSRVADDLLSIGRIVTGLEAMTGADMLVSPLPEPLPPALTSGFRLHEMLLHEHCAVGWLVQRKSGLDLPHSLAKLTSNILPRMRNWCNFCWLLATGSHDYNNLGNIVVGANRLEVEASWSALQGALLAWQLDGGYYALLDNDRLIVPWLEQVDETLQDWHAQGGRPEKWVSHKPTRDVLRSEDEPALAVLVALPNIGITRARACLEVWGAVATCLFWLSDPELYEADPELYPDGVGLKTVQNIHECLGGTLTSTLKLGTQA